MSNTITWNDGEKVEYTGKQDMYYGKMFYEVKVLTGHKKGQLQSIVRSPEWEKKCKEAQNV